MEKRTLQELNLLDDFLFGKMITYPEIGEQFCKQLLSTILNVKLNRIRIVPQKIYLGADTNLHGARLDVYIEEEDNEINGTLFDMEPDKNDRETLKKALPQRGRFYHSMLDQECLKSGQGYEALKRVIVISDNPYYRSFEGGILTLNTFITGSSDTVVYWDTSGERITDRYDFDAFCMSELIDNGILIYGNDIRTTKTL